MTAVLLLGCGAAPSPSSAPSAVPAPAAPTATAGVATSSPAASPTSSVAAAVPSELAVDCTATGTSVAGDTVGVQLDGVHFRIQSVAEGTAFQVDGVGGDNAPFRTGSLTFAVPPGDIRIWCGPTDPSAADWVTVHVVDPGKLYTADTLSCDSGTTGSVDYAQGARGEPGDPIAIARRQLQGLRPADIVEGAGYPATEVREVRVTRDGAVIAVISYQPDGNGGWLIGGAQTCADAGLKLGL